MLNPNFDHLCDTIFAAKILQQLPLFAQNRFQIIDCRILRTRKKIFKKTHRSFLNVCYAVKFTDSNGGKPPSEILFLRAFCDGRSEKEFRSAAGNTGVFWLPEIDAVVYRFPCDPKMPQLAGLLDAQKVMGHLPFSALSAAVAAPELIKKIDIRVAHYYPEHRCTAKYILHSTLHGETEPVTIYGKTFRDASGQQTFRNLLALREHLQHPDDFSTPAPLGYSDKTHTLWMTDANAIPLPEILKSAAQTEILFATGKALRKFHTRKLPLDLRIEKKLDLPEVAKKAGKIARAFPAVSGQIDALIHYFQSNPPLAANELCTLHGDFHPNQLAVSDNRLFLFDFDELCLGDAEWDLASFIVDLQVNNYPQWQIEAMVSALLSGYCDENPSAISPDRLAYYICMQLLTKAYRLYSYRSHIKNLAGQISRLIGLVNFENQLIVSAHSRKFPMSELTSYVRMNG